MPHPVRRRRGTRSLNHYVPGLYGTATFEVGPMVRKLFPALLYQLEHQFKPLSHEILRGSSTLVKLIRLVLTGRRLRGIVTVKVQKFDTEMISLEPLLTDQFFSPSSICIDPGPLVGKVNMESMSRQPGPERERRARVIAADGEIPGPPNGPRQQPS